jgi:hypothetical protein
MAYSAHETRATKVPVSVTSGRHITKLTVDQTQPLPAGQLFHDIDTVELTADVETVITISNENTDGFVILDALQLTREQSDDDRSERRPANSGDGVHPSGGKSNEYTEDNMRICGYALRNWVNFLVLRQIYFHVLEKD